MDDSDSSGLSEHSDKEIQKLAPIFQKAKANASKVVKPAIKPSPQKPKRPPSPPHEEVLADSPDIAFICMFRSRFNDAMPSKLPHLGPQDIERGVVETQPSPELQQLLCTFLALVLNRKKPVERGHHGRALEEAVLGHKKEWPSSWEGNNPLHGGKNFENMSPVERLNLLRTLIMWALSDSEAIGAIIKEKYKQSRHNDDENQPLSVQPWGFDGDKRRYFLVQGLDDTSFRVYREGGRYSKSPHWYSVAGTIDEVKELAKKLEELDTTQAARRLAGRITNAIPTFEATEEKRRRREYRQIRRAAFTRPEPGFSLYEGRTRGKRMRYNYDDDDDAFDSDATSTRRSARQSGRSTPFEAMPTVTASGRQVRQPRTGEYGESLLSAPPMTADELAPGYSDAEGATSRGGRSGTEDSEQPVRPGGRATRGASRPSRDEVNLRKRKYKHIDSYNSIDDMSGEEDSGASADDWDSDKNEVEHEPMPDLNDDDEMSEADEESEAEDEEPPSLLLKLKVPSTALARFDIRKATLESAGSPLIKHAQEGANEDDVSDAYSNIAPASNHDALHPQEQQQVATSSPMGPSAYPTPTSSSFLAPDRKIPVLPPAETVSHIQTAPYGVDAKQSSNPIPMNGVHKTALTPHADESRPHTLLFQNHHAHPSAGSAWP